MSDYRDKAAELRRQVVWASNEAIDIISPALLEAHNAGREEAAKLIEANMLVGDGRDGTERLHPRTNPGNKVGFAYAHAIRSLP